MKLELSMQVAFSFLTIAGGAVAPMNLALAFASCNGTVDGG